MSLFWWIPFGKVPEMPADQIEKMRQDSGTALQILDVRTGLEWKASHIPGAINVPITEFNARLKALQLDKSRPVIAICLSAHRSIPAVRKLRQQGFKQAYQLRGGMLSWWHAKLPVTGDGSEPAKPNCK